MENINLQLYSFGHDCPLSAVEKIKKAGEMGYAGVEFAQDYKDVPVEDIKKALEDVVPKVSSGEIKVDTAFDESFDIKGLRDSVRP